LLREQQLRDYVAVKKAGEQQLRDYVAELHDQLELVALCDNARAGTIGRMGPAETRGRIVGLM
jgi:hypothetical protein